MAHSGRLPSTRNDRRPYEVCRAIRAQGLNLPILMLTAKGQEEDIVLGLAVASGTPDAIVKRIADALAKGMNTDDVRKRVEASGLEVSTNTPAEFAALLENQRKALGASLAKRPLPPSP